MYDIENKYEAVEKVETLKERIERTYAEVLSKIMPRHCLTIWGLDHVITADYMGKSDLLLALLNLNEVTVVEWKHLGTYDTIGKGVKLFLNRTLDGEELDLIESISITQEIICFPTFEWGDTTKLKALSLSG